MKTGTIAAIAVVLIVVAAIIAISLTEPPRLNRVTGCPTDPGHTKSTVFVLLDTTGRVTATQAEHIEQIVQQAIDGAGAYSQITIFEVLPSREQLLTPVFDYCKPDPDNPFAAPFVQRFDEFRFDRTVMEFFAGIEFDRPTSPIIQAMGSVSTYFRNAEGELSFIIISDFMENSDLLNQYSPGWMSMTEAQEKRLLDSSPRLNGVSLSMGIIARSNVPHHDRDFAEWWMRYLTRSGAMISDQVFSGEQPGEEHIVYAVEWIRE